MILAVFIIQDVILKNIEHWLKNVESGTAVPDVERDEEGIRIFIKGMHWVDTNSPDPEAATS